MSSKLIAKILVLGAMTVALVAVLAAIGPAQRGTVNAASPGGTVAPLLSCSNVDASVDNKVTVADILSVVYKFGKNWGQPGYAYLYDGVAPYNPSSPPSTGSITVSDILRVVQHYGLTCPVTDTQVARATQWAIDMDMNMANGLQPVPQTENEAALEAIGYYQGSNDVPGQGVHYINVSNWDGVFNPAAPEGLVYNNGKLAAQLYVADAPTVGLGTHNVGPCTGSCPGKIDGIELETAADGPMCASTSFAPACSWNGGEKWHLHYYLCTVGIGTAGAFAIPGSFAPTVGDTKPHCAAYAGTPECTTPITTQPCYRWAQYGGWMGHLYNWYPNGNMISDPAGGMNGRFADCFPDAEGWKATNCPG